MGACNSKNAEKYAQLVKNAEEDDKAARAGNESSMPQGCKWLALGGIGLVCLGIIITAIVYLARGNHAQGQGQGPQGQEHKVQGPLATVSMKDVQKVVSSNSVAAPEKCGDVANNTEIEGESFVKFDHVPHPEMCCSMCHGVLKCKGWQLVNASLEGCPLQCWLFNRVTGRKAHHGSVSGTPPERPLAVLPKVEKGGDGTSMLCLSLILPKGYEMGMIQLQHKLKISIFACDAYGVYSNATLQVAPGISTGNIGTDLSCDFGGDSGTALNAWIFIFFWHRVIKDGHYLNHDWTVKVDADAAFFPDRLRPVLQDHKGASYLNNCQYGMHGPIEVLGKLAMNTLKEDYDSSPDKKSPKKCVTEMHFGLWGEDMFLDQCLKKVHKLESELDHRLMCEAHCECKDWYWCNNDTQRVSYHPFKRPDMYIQCMANAVAGASR